MPIEVRHGPDPALLGTVGFQTGRSDYLRRLEEEARARQAAEAGRAHASAERAAGAAERAAERQQDATRQDYWRGQGMLADVYKQHLGLAGDIYKQQLGGAQRLEELEFRQAGEQKLMEQQFTGRARQQVQEVRAANDMIREEMKPGGLFDPTDPIRGPQGEKLLNENMHRLAGIKPLPEPRKQPTIQEQINSDVSPVAKDGSDSMGWWVRGPKGELKHQMPPKKDDSETKSAAKQEELAAKQEEIRRRDHDRQVQTWQRDAENHATDKEGNFSQEKYDAYMRRRQLEYEKQQAREREDRMPPEKPAPSAPRDIPPGLEYQDWLKATGMAHSPETVNQWYVYKNQPPQPPAPPRKILSPEEWRKQPEQRAEQSAGPWGTAKKIWQQLPATEPPAPPRILSPRDMVARIGAAMAPLTAAEQGQERQPVIHERTDSQGKPYYVDSGGKIVPKIASEQDRDKLRPGSYYMAPNGKLMRVR